MKILVSFCLLMTALTGFSQETFELHIVNEHSEPVPNVEVHIEAYGHHFLGNQMGVVKIPVSESNNISIEVKAEGYENQIVDVEFGKTNSHIVLKHAHRLLDKVIVSSELGIQRESIANVSRQKISDISVIKSESLGEALSNITGVDVTGIGPGISKPVIRGLSGSSVVTYVNGLRIQNQQWGGDHGLPITSLGIGSVEVVKGPASLLYGADAMGGVLYFKDEPFARHNTQSEYVSTRFDANSLGGNVNAGYRVSAGQWHINSYLGYDNQADYKLPNGNMILNSRYNQMAGKFVLGRHQKKWLFRLNYDFYRGRLGLPGHTHSVNPVASDFETSKQKRGLNSPAQAITNHFISTENQFFFGKSTITLIVGNTNNQLNEHEDKIFTPDIMMNLNNSLYHLKWQYKLSKKMKLLVGSQGMFQINKNGEEAIEYLIPDAATKDLGGYVLLNYNHLNWRFQAGSRFDGRQINSFETGDFSAIDRQYFGANYSIGSAYLSKKTTLRLNLSSGFRAPNSSELLANGVHHGTLRYEIGNVNLKTENALQIDGSMAWHFDDLELIVNPFYNHITNYIYIEPSGVYIDDFQVFNYKQAESARLYGVDFGFHYHPHHFHWLHLESNFSGLLASDENNNDLPLIPQSNIRTQISAEFNMKTRIKVDNFTVQYHYFFAQNRVGEIDTPSNAYGLLNINLENRVSVKRPVYLSIGAKNLLNESFIPHLSNLKYLGIYNPGRNIYVALRVEFNKRVNNQ